MKTWSHKILQQRKRGFSQTLQEGKGARNVTLWFLCPWSSNPLRFSHNSIRFGHNFCYTKPLH
jgi:hypothetical protein